MSVFLIFLLDINLGCENMLLSKQGFKDYLIWLKEKWYAIPASIVIVVVTYFTGTYVLNLLFN